MIRLQRKPAKDGGNRDCFRHVPVALNRGRKMKRRFEQLLVHQNMTGDEMQISRHDSSEDRHVVIVNLI